MKEITIAISGQICRENSANLHSFWRGFINIQKALRGVENVNIVAHSWNPEFDVLVNKVYKPDVLLSEKQSSFVDEFMPAISPVNKFERGLKRADSTWKKCSPQALLGNAKSRSKAVSLIKDLGLEQHSTVMAVRWDQGCTGSAFVNQVVFDTALPPNYLYMAYYSEVDEGYADMWFVAPLEIAEKFEGYSQFMLEAFSGENSFFTDFTKDGWPLAISKSKFSSYKKLVKELILRKIIKLIDKAKLKSLLPLLAHKIAGLELRLQSEIRKPSISGENSLSIDSQTEVSFPSYQALNNHAILKSFVLKEGLRDETRFLDIYDFGEQQNKPCYVINPIDFVYVIYSHSSFADCWEMAIGQALECLPDSCKKIYLVSEGSSLTESAFAQYSSFPEVELITYDESLKYSQRLKQVFNIVKKKSEFVYFVHEDMPLIESVDSVYLNALLHHMDNSNEFYIKLVDTDFVDAKDVHESFPDLVKNAGGYAFSVQPALIKSSVLTSFLTNFDEDIYGLEQLAVSSNFIFSAVQGDRKVGRYLLANSYFPHVATAISKGKWCTDEWKEEIDCLAGKYSIDLSIRGEVDG